MGKAPVYIATTGQSTQLQSHASDGAFVSAKGSPADARDLYYNSALTAVRYYDGTTWRSLSASDLTETLTNKTLTTPFINGTRLKVRTLTANASPDLTDDILLCDATSAAFTVTMPLASSAINKVYQLKKIDASVNPVNFVANGYNLGTDQLIGGVSFNRLLNRYDSVQIVCDGTTWHFLGFGPLIGARYTTAAGPTISNVGETVVQYNTADFDSHAAVTTGASWKFTAPINGKYRYSASNTYGNSTQTYIASLLAYKTPLSSGIAALVQALSFYKSYSSSAGASLVIADTVSMLAGDTLQIRATHNAGVGLSLSTAAANNVFAIERVGN